MPANVQLKVLSLVAPDLYKDPDNSEENVPIHTANSTPFNVATILEEVSRIGFAFCDDVLDSSLISGVREEMSGLELKQGGMALQWKEESMRGDRFVWLRPGVVQGRPHLTTLLASMEQWRRQINDITSGELAEMKFMAAVYPGGGARYVRHSVWKVVLYCTDALQDVSEFAPDRRLTAILYLNENWQPHHGGQLHIDAYDGKRYEIAPVANRVLFFHSVLMHEVRPAHRERAAVTGWYYGPRELFPGPPK